MDLEKPAREVILPASALLTLRRTLRSEAGPLPTVHALHDAGYSVGESMAEILVEDLDGGPGEVSAQRYWDRFGAFWARRGWGRLRHEDAHPRIGLLRSDDWAEAGEATEETQPSCAFTAGVLAGLLGRTAGAPLAVLEVACRARGDGECVFAFGSETRVHDLYGSLLEGEDLDAVLAAL